jgi:hypothetical protein
LILPLLIKIRQKFPDRHLVDIAEAVHREIAPLAAAVPAGSRIAITAGSRGIANLSLIIRTVVHDLRALGIFPFIVPAMGSHGGATAEGQREVLAGYGITEELVGAPVLSSMDVVELPRGDLDHRIFQDRLAFEADGIIVINRIKVHTDFSGQTESGLLKMCVIGLGKHRQALEIHRFGIHGLRDLVPRAAGQIIRQSKIIFGLGIVENACDETLVIRAIRPDRLEAEEARLLEICRQNMPRLPVQQLELLIVDEMGKEISGTGMDTGIIGRRLIRHEPEPESPDIAKIVVTDLTESSHGNALGVGLADFITRRLYQKIDFAATYANILTSTFTDRGKIPMIAATDHGAAEYASQTWGPVDPEKARIIRIKNTLKLDEIYVSRPVLAGMDAAAQTGAPAVPYERAGNYQEIFDPAGNLKEF